MSEIDIAKLWGELEDELVGFRANTTKVKPVHLMNGMMRQTKQRILQWKNPLHRFVFTEKADGGKIKGHSPEEVFTELKAAGRLAEDISITQESVQRLRTVAKKIVAADNGVFTQQMQSYTCAHWRFATKDQVGSSAGEFFSEWLKNNSPVLFEKINSDLDDSCDAISLLCSPVLSDPNETIFEEYERNFSDCRAFEFPQTEAHCFKKMSLAADCLAYNLDTIRDKFLRQRMIVLFMGFFLIRYMCSLENLYCMGRKWTPLLLDCIPTANKSHVIHTASKLSFLKACQSIGRFYDWAFTEKLKSSYSITELSISKIPANGAGSKKEQKEEKSHEIWELAKEESKTASNPFAPFGEALFDIICENKNADPVRYTRQLGVRIGMLWPPNNTQPQKSVLLTQDLMSTLLLCVVKRGEPPVSLDVLLDRLHEVLGFVVGGRKQDELALTNVGILTVTGDALKENRQLFSNTLARLGYAEHLADGVIQIRVGDSAC